MEHIKGVLPQIWASPAWKKRLQAGEVLSRWEEIVGPAIARAARPKSFSKGRLIVEVEDSIWMNQLHFEEKRILSLLNAQAGEELFQEIRWVLSKRPFRKHLKRATKAKEISPRLRQQIEKEVAVIEDPELRQAFLRLRLTLLKKGQRASRLERYKDHLGIGR